MKSSVEKGSEISQYHPFSKINGIDCKLVSLCIGNGRGLNGQPVRLSTYSVSSGEFLGVLKDPAKNTLRISIHSYDSLSNGGLAMRVATARLDHITELIPIYTPRVLAECPDQS